MQFASPNSSYGYFRGSPIYGGYGSGQGQNMAGNNTFAMGQGGAVGGSDSTAWTPTILYLFVLIIAEMFIFAFLSRHV